MISLRLVPHIKPEIRVDPVFLVNPYQLLDGQSVNREVDTPVFLAVFLARIRPVFLISGCEEGSQSRIPSLSTGAAIRVDSRNTIQNVTAYKIDVQVFV